MSSFVRLPNTVGDFKVSPLGGNLYALEPTTGYILQTGAAVTVYLELPVKHRLVRVDIKHTDSADADSTDALAYSISKRHTGNIYIVLAADAACVVSDVIESFGEDFPMGNTNYLIVTTTTNTDRLYLVFVIEAYGG